MRIAVASEGLEVSSYFESCTNYSCFTVENGTIVDSRNLSRNALQNKEPGKVLFELGMDTVIVGCISEGSLAGLTGCGLTVFAGAMGNAQESVKAYITNTFIACDESCDEYLESTQSPEAAASGD
ncbi:MAG: hypothetical protein FWG23_07770 [Eggerthellaceae bacterium]|nr:hypothetical protein [Eggerthellaceae bacterium]